MVRDTWPHDMVYLVRGEGESFVAEYDSPSTIPRILEAFYLERVPLAGRDRDLYRLKPFIARIQFSAFLKGRI